MSEVLRDLQYEKILALYSQIENRGPLDLKQSYPDPLPEKVDDQDVEIKPVKVNAGGRKLKKKQEEMEKCFEVFDNIDAEEESSLPVTKMTPVTFKHKRQPVARFGDVLQSIARMKHNEDSKSN